MSPLYLEKSNDVILTALFILLLLLLLLLLLMLCAPSLHRVRLASETNLPGTAESVDRGSASVVVKISSRACSVPGQSSQCSSVCAAWRHLVLSINTVCMHEGFSCCYYYTVSQKTRQLLATTSPNVNRFSRHT